MLDGLDWLAGGGIGNGAEEAPCVEGSVAEELVDGTVIFVAASFDGVVLNALAFVDGLIAAGLHVELIDSVDRDGGPDVARVAVATSADKG
jgi:hypothetical protein